jgi:pyruvate dehydrogenase E2 component (dihydrolipoamide acetyltransferase)
MVVEFKFPDLGEGIAEGEIKKWLVKKGDVIEVDQSLAEVETDKAVVEVPSPSAGKVLDLRFKEGDIVLVGEVLAVIGEEGEKPEKAKPTEKVVERKPSISVVGELPEAPEEAEPVEKPKEVLATPKVRKLAEELKVEISKITGSGKDGRVLEKDVRAAVEKVVLEPEVKEKVEEKKPKKVPKFDLYGWVDRVPVRGVRRTTSKRMVESLQKTAPVTSTEMADVTKLVELRTREKEVVMRTRGVKLTYMPFIVKAVVEALKGHPYLNAVMDDENEEIILKRYYNIGIAVAIEDGLIVPVIKGADQKSIFELAEDIQRLAEAANNRTIDIADLKGGTFTITNYGVIGGLFGTPIINYPEAAILGAGAIRDTPMVKDGEVKVRKVIHLSLTFDHRVLDGAEAQKFLNTLVRYLEDPELILMSA